MSRLRVAWISYRPPWPPLKGDQLVTSEQVKHLAEDFGNEVELHLLSLYRHKSETEAVQRGLGQYFTGMHWFPLPVTARVAGLPRTLGNGMPMQVNYFTAPAQVRAMRRVLAELRPDVIHTQTIRTGPYIPQGIPFVLDMLDLLSLNMQRRSEGERFPWRQIFATEARLLRRYEDAMYNRADSVLLVSEKDRAAWGRPDVVVNPNGTFITPEYLARYSHVQPRNAFVFHGGMSYFPNVQAALYLAREVWPAIHTAAPDWTLLIAGNNPAPEVKRLHGRDGVEVTGYVPDICETLCGCRIGIYPLLAGTGMLNKVLESMSAGLPLVATSRAMQGFPGRRGDEAFEVDDTAGIIEASLRLVRDEALRKETGARAQRYMWENYSWQRNAQTIVNCWQRAVAAHTP